MQSMADPEGNPVMALPKEFGNTVSASSENITVAIAENVEKDYRLCPLERVSNRVPP